MDSKLSIPRRQLLTGAAAAFTTSLFTGRVKGANDRIAVGFSVAHHRAGTTIRAPTDTRTRPCPPCQTRSAGMVWGRGLDRPGDGLTAAAAGINYEQLCQRMVELALRRESSFAHDE